MLPTCFVVKNGRDVKQVQRQNVSDDDAELCIQMLQITSYLVPLTNLPLSQATIDEIHGLIGKSKVKGRL